MSRSFTNQTENDVLDWLFGSSTFELQLFTDLPNDDGVGTQPSGAANYSAKPIVFGAAAGGVISNSSQVVFAGPTAPWGKIVAWAVKDTVAGVVRATGYMGTFLDYIWKVGADLDALQMFGGSTPAAGTRVLIVARDPSGVATGNPSFYGLTAFDISGLTEYYVVNPSAPDFQLSLTPGGPAEPIAAFGSEHYRLGDFQLWTSKTITPSLGDILVFAPGTISISLK